MTDIPKNSRPVRGTFVEIVRYKRYKDSSEQKRRGIEGRWQKFNGYGWENCEAPDSWESIQEETA